MICPECKKENKKSRVYLGSSFTTLMAPVPYYDEDGRLHVHDPNITTISYSCSNGHSWTVKKSGECWCGWGK